MTKRSQLNLLIDSLVHILGNLNLSDSGLSNSDSRSSIAIGTKTKTSIAMGTETKSIAVAEWNTSSIGQDRGSLFSSSFISRTLTASLSLGQTGDRESKHILASSLLDSISDGLHRNLNLLDDMLDDMRSVGEGRSKAIRVVHSTKEQLGVSRGSSKDRTHQQALHFEGLWTSSV